MDRELWRQQIEELKKLVASLQKELSDAKEADRKSSGVIAGLEEELRRLRERVAQLESALKDLQGKLAQSEQEKEKILKQVLAFEKQVLHLPSRGSGLHE